jgi:hypothetical protein
MINLFATVMHVPQIVLCMLQSTVNIGKCKQQVTELLLHMITIKYCMKFSFPHCIIICYNHNHIKLVTCFFWGGGGQLPLLLSPTVYSPVRCVCESSFFADTCTRRVPIFLLSVAQRKRKNTRFFSDV